MTPSQFVERTADVIEGLALAFSFGPDKEVDRSLDEFRSRLLRDWLRTLPLSESDIVAGVDCIVERVRARRREIEATSFGIA